MLSKNTPFVFVYMVELLTIHIKPQAIIDNSRNFPIEMDELSQIISPRSSLLLLK
jgi:hypothetical protein